MPFQVPLTPGPIFGARLLRDEYDWDTKRQPVGTDTLFSLWSDQALAIGPRGVVTRDLCGMRKASRPEHRDQGRTGRGREGGREGGMGAESRKKTATSKHTTHPPQPSLKTSPHKTAGKKNLNRAGLFADAADRTRGTAIRIFTRTYVPTL